MKKIICFMLVMVLMFSLASTAFAYNEDKNISFNEEIEVYLTRLSESTLIKEYSTNGQIDFDKLRVDVESGKTRSNEIHVTKLEYAKIKESSSPIILRLIDSLDETRAKGYEIHSVIIVLPSVQGSYDKENANDELINRGNPNDPNYWIQNTTYWGTYQNQDIRYYYSSISVSKPKANVGNRPSTWPSILSAFVRIAIDSFFENTYLDTLYETITNIQSVLGAATPVNYVFDSATEWVKSETVGTLTNKEVVLEDIDNKISGYAYYPWGSLQRLQFQTRVEVKYYAGIQNGSPSYPVVTSPYSKSRFVESRYYSNSTLLFPILRQYYNYYLYSMYTERVDLDSALF